MDYEKKHKGEVIRATQLWECGDITRENLEYIFPELRKSDDERIRKALINLFKIENFNGYTTINGIDVDDVIAWLEKQGDKAQGKSACGDEEYNGEDYGIDGLWHAHRILEKTLGKVDGYQSDDGILEHKCAITAVKKLYGQKPSWSEEDDYNLQCMIAKVDNDIQNGNVGRNQELIDWLKSIKLRMEEQK